MTPLRLFLSAVSLALLSACTTMQSEPPTGLALDPLASGRYPLGTGDVLTIAVLGQADLTGSYTVNEAGMVSFPLIGLVAAEGRTAIELESTITARLRENYLRDPDVTVQVAQYRPFFILGEVATAGQYSYVSGLTVQQAVAIAGGFTPRANQRVFVVTRPSNGVLVTSELGLLDEVLPGDTVTVRQRIF